MEEVEVYRKKLMNDVNCMDMVISVFFGMFINLFNDFKILKIFRYYWFLNNNSFYILLSFRYYLFDV